MKQIQGLSPSGVRSLEDYMGRHLKEPHRVKAWANDVAAKARVTHKGAAEFTYLYEISGDHTTTGAPTLVCFDESDFNLVEVGQ
jgi:hypothetical protein